MLRLLSILLVAVVVGCTINVAANDSLAALAGEFKVFRAQKGHFSGGEWNDALDRFDGRKHQVMIELAERLGDGTHSRAEIVALLGEPDAVLKPTDMMYRQAYAGKDPQVRELLVYHWRGWHDFLYFASDGVRARSADWWMAFE